MRTREVRFGPDGRLPPPGTVLTRPYKGDAVAYVKSQAGEGWMLLPERYDDGGFSGGTTDRPALKRLMRAVETGEVDCVVVYKVDRLSRSLPDFARLMETFDKARVSFVSVTQQFNTATSMGRPVLSVLLSFAQFEREIIGERTRDKIAATRRKGKWAGGRPVLGYDVDRASLRLVVNETEAGRVRAIFALYLGHGSLLDVTRELARRGRTTKRWATRSGEELGGRPFTRAGLHQHPTNVVYAGNVRYKDEVHPGEHAAIVDERTWQQVQSLLARNGRAGAFAPRCRSGAILQGLLRCGPCDCAMTPTHTARAKGRRYRYYVCGRAQKRGRAGCPSKSVPAGQIEAFVVDQIKGIGRDPALVDEVLARVEEQADARAADLEAERRAVQRDLAAWHREVRDLSGRLPPEAENDPHLARLADLHERIARAEGRQREPRDRLAAVRAELPDGPAAARALTAFDPVWAALDPREQARVLRLLVERVAYDGAAGTVAVTFRPAGIKALADGHGEGDR